MTKNARYLYLHTPHLYHKIIGALLCCLPALLPLASLSAQPQGEAASPVVLSKVWVEGDSVVVGIRFDFAGIDVRPHLALWFSPVLRGEKQYLVLPPVAVSGKARARADRRNRFLAAGRDALHAALPTTREPEPYRVLRGNSPKRGNEIDYRIAVAYSPWMRNASLCLMLEDKNCCRLTLLGVEILTERLTLTGGFTIPQDTTGCQAAGNYAAMMAQADAPRQAPEGNGTQEGDHVSSTPAMRAELPYESLVPCAECTAMVSYLLPDLEASKERTEGAVLHIDYPAGVHDVRRTYLNNAAELARIDSLLRPLTEGGLTTFRHIAVCGYASPEGTYADNEQLASRRAQGFMRYLTHTYRLPESLFQVTWVPEDWDGLLAMLRAERPEYADESIALIRRYAVFDGRERRLMELRAGVPYRRMLKDQFPRLRRLQLTVDYHVRNFNIEEAARLIYTHPKLLSLQEMYRVASFHRPGTEQYREIYEIAAFHFPTDVVANVNAASAVIMAGDLVSARRYIEKVKDDPRTWNNLGVMAYLSGHFEEAAEWFRRAAGTEPEKARKNLKKVMRRRGDKETRRQGEE